MVEKETIKVLIVEDEPVQAKVLMKVLRHAHRGKYETIHASDLKQAREHIENSDLDLVLLDLNLPDSIGIETFNSVHEFDTSLPVIILSGVDDEKLSIDIVKQGAQDYLVKGHESMDEIDRAIVFAVERKQFEKENLRLQSLLNQERRLEAIGALASGIAHEINTPMQFIGANIFYISKTMEKFWGFYDKCSMDCEHLDEEERKMLAELGPIKEGVNEAVAETREGFERVKAIVRAMNTFSRQSGREYVQHNINQSIKDSVIISRNEWKYNAEVIMDLDETLPPAMCYPEEVAQAFLNIIINSAHSINEKVSDTADEDGHKERGTITISSGVLNDMIVISISDTGMGIPEPVRHRVFEPFFTTKKIGQGTGQGLALAHNIIVAKHNGNISFETEEGVGTTFKILLPIVQQSAAASANGDSSYINNNPQGQSNEWRSTYQ